MVLFYPYITFVVGEVHLNNPVTKQQAVSGKTQGSSLALLQQAVSPL
jgi:hypothetical protein